MRTDDRSDAQWSTLLVIDRIILTREPPAMLSVEVPEEPDDGSVVLDRESVAWQRLDARAPADSPERRWFCALPKVPAFVFAAKGPRSWLILLAHEGPLAPMVAESAVEDGWRRAGYETPTAERFVQPPSISDVVTRRIADES